VVTDPTDNQSAIQTIDASKQHFGQYIVKKILDIIDRAYEIRPICNIHIEWLPGHEDINGNEQADQAVKMTATPNSILPTTRMRSAQKRSIKFMMRIKWEIEWKTGKANTKRLRKMSQQSGITTGLKLYGAL
jgi:hypothetical protein